MVESSSLVSVLFREAFSHPYISFFHLLVTVFSVITIINQQLLQTDFLECTEANATLLIPIYAILREICAFIIGFSCTVWTKMRSFAGSLADGVLADAILISSLPTDTAHEYKDGNGNRKKYGNY